MNHLDSLPWGWWERKWRERNAWPDTLGDPRNYVLTIDELKEYHTVLQVMKADIEREADRVRNTVQVLTDERAYFRTRDDPVMFTLAHLLEFMVKMGRGKLSFLQLMCGFTSRRVLTKGEQA